MTPDIGALFTYQGERYRVTCWLRKMPPPVEPPASERNFMRDLLNDILYETQQQVGPDRCRLQFCLQDEAEYVGGAGVCGCIARVGDIEVTGMVPWPTSQLAGAREHAERLAGSVVW